MAREFVISPSNVTVANAAVTLVFINPAAAPNFNIEILRCWVSQSANATSAQQRVQLTTQVTAFPTLTTFTPAKLNKADPNVSIIVGGTAGAAGTCGVNASAEGAGGKTVILEDAFNVLNGWLWVPTPAETIIETAQATAHGFGLVFPAAPTSLTNWNAGMVVRELG